MNRATASTGSAPAHAPASAPGSAPARRTGGGRRWLATGPLLIALANFLIALCAALTTALLALVLEDALPLTWPLKVSAGLWSLLAVSAVLLFGTVLLRGRIHRHTGTLFYVRLLGDEMTDRHDTALQAAARGRMSLRSVTRWVDLPTRTSNGVIDISATCADVSAALETAVNTDRDDTAYTIAPNTLWPAALVIGAELPIVDGLRLLELPDPTPRPVSFTLTEPVAPAGIVTDELNLHTGTPGAPVGILLAFTRASVRMTPEKTFGQFSLSRCCRIRPAGIDGIEKLADVTFTGPEIAAFARPLAEAIIRVQDEAGTRGVIIAAAITKTLAVAVGWELAQANTRFFAHTHLLHHDQQTDSYVPVRVHPAQPAHPPRPALTGSAAAQDSTKNPDQPDLGD